MQSINVSNHAQTVHQIVIVKNYYFTCPTPSQSSSTIDEQQHPPDLIQPIQKSKSKLLLKAWEHFKTFVEIALLWVHSYPIIVPAIMNLFGKIGVNICNK